MKNNIGYLLKEGIRGIFLHGFMSFAAVFVTIGCLLIVGTFASVTYNVKLMVQDLNQTNEVIAYVDETLTLAQAHSIETQIRGLDNIASAEFRTNAQALEDFIADHEGDEAFSALEADDLRHRVVVVLEDNNLMKQTVSQLEDIQGVAKVTASFALAEGFTMIQNVLQVSSLVVIVALLGVSLFIIFSTVKMAMNDRQDEIAIMKMVGATNGFIRLPYVVEGFTLGITAAAVAFGLEWLLYDTMLGWLKEVDTLQLLQFVPFEELLMPMVIIFSGAGVLVGLVGSWFSIRKFMNV